MSCSREPSETMIDSTIQSISFQELINKKGLDSEAFQHAAIRLSDPIEKHAAWIFQHIYAKPYTAQAKHTSGIARFHHGMQHICRVAIYIPVFANLYRKYDVKEAYELTDNDIKLLQIAALFHDAGREDDNVDYWDHDSAALACFYLANMDDVPEDKFLQIAMAIANKDINEKFYQFISCKKNSSIEYKLLPKNPQKNMLQQILANADCLDIIRARPYFDANYLDFYKQIVEKQDSSMDSPLDVMAKLITEARSIINKHGDSFHHTKSAIKLKYENEKGFTLILESIDASQHPIIKQLYNNGSLLTKNELRALTPFISFYSFTRKKGLEEKNLEAALREGKLFYRGVVAPSSIHRKPITQEGVLPREATFAEIEILKLLRRPNIATTSSKADRFEKSGNPDRSISLLGWGNSIARAAGFIILNIPISNITSIASVDTHSGWFKKDLQQEFDSTNTLFKTMQIQNDIKKLLHESKMGGSAVLIGKNYFSHNEIIANLKRCHAIGFSNDPNVGNGHCTGNDESPSLHSPLLQAVFLQKEYEKITGKLLPIFEYSGIHNFLIKQETLTEEKIIDLWISMCRDYLKSMVENFDHFDDSQKLKFSSQLINLEIENIKIHAMYGMGNYIFSNILITRKIAKAMSAGDSNYPSTLQKIISKKIETLTVSFIQELDFSIQCQMWAYQNDFGRANKLLASGKYLPNIFHAAFLHERFDFIDHWYHNKSLKIQDDVSLINLVIKNRDNKVLLYLLKSQANIQHCDQEGYTPLLNAIKENNVEALILLLLFGASPNEETSSKQATHPIFMATAYNRPEMINILIYFGANINNSYEISIQSIIGMGKTDLQKNQLRKLFFSENTNAHHVRGFTTLHLAVLMGSEKLVKALLTKGSKGNKITWSLKLATAMNFQRIVNLLNNKQRDPIKINNDYFKADPNIALLAYVKAITLLNHHNLLCDTNLEIISKLKNYERVAQIIVILNKNNLWTDINKNALMHCKTLDYADELKEIKRLDEKKSLTNIKFNAIMKEELTQNLVMRGNFFHLKEEILKKQIEVTQPNSAISSPALK